MIDSVSGGSQNRAVRCEPRLNDATALFPCSPVLLPYLPVLPMEEEIAIAGRCPNRFFLNLTGGESPAIVRVYLDSSFRARDIKRTLKMNLKEDRRVDTPRSPNKIPKRNLPPEKSELPWHYTGEIKSTDTKCCRFHLEDSAHPTANQFPRRPTVSVNGLSSWPLYLERSS